MPTTNDAHVRNHWYWRPGWRAGRHLYACHLTLDDQPQLRELIDHCQDALAHLENLDLIPPGSLHLTMQRIGWADEISSTELEVVAERIADRLRDAPRPVVTFHQPTVWDEAIVLKALPAEPIYALRVAVYQAIEAALGPRALPVAPPAPEQFVPHVSVAYVNGDGLAQPVFDALSRVRLPLPVAVTFRVAPILTFHRDHQMYEWNSAVPIPIGPQ
ncbi:MAG: 2'-5' RNA ligase family protein [Streptosporangiaceae bacterium]